MERFDGDGVEEAEEIRQRFADLPPVRLEGFVDEDACPIVIPEDACKKCLHVLSIGEYPFCPHGFGGASVISDEIVGGMVMDHVFPGRKVYSKRELKDLIATKGWRLADGTTEANHAKFLKERGEYAGDTQKQRDRERLER